MKRLRIGWLYQDLNPGGGQRVCKELSLRLAQRGHDVTIIVPRGRSKGVQIPGVKIIGAGIKITNPELSIIASLPFMLKHSANFDVLISSMPFMGILNALSRKVKLKYHWIHSDDMGLFDDRTLIKSGIGLTLYHLTVKLSYKLPVKYWCNSKWTADKFRTYSRKNCTIIPVGIDENIFRPANKDNRKGNLIGIIGRRTKLKGYSDAVEALNIVHQKGHEFRLRIITQETIQTDNCKFPFEVRSPKNDSELAGLLSECGVFVSSSWFEGFSLPPLEAMACRVTVVTTDSGGCREYAVHENNCLMTEPKNPDILASAIERLLTDRELADRLADNGYKTSKEFTWDRTTDMIEKIFFRDLVIL